ncbi:MAG: fibrobacter succinogenes major paralogous domain-containing protein [Alistipes sp.]|nr:fibrobacter succinogenes major paralogous domain-containing protein [Alistipes senegalensis]MCM1249965.1 fibrobacter succinogenes major paralogous domain-containing protein [Alistipes sp.]
MLHAPASGYRNYQSGALTNVGTTGVCWSSSPLDAGSVNGGDLIFDAGRVKPFDNNNRSYGFTVRCVQHLQAAIL